jgi:hypothetical protein
LRLLLTGTFVARLCALDRIFSHQHTKPGGIAVDQQIPNRHLTRIIAEQGPCYDFLLQTHRAQREGLAPATARFAVAGAATTSRETASAATSGAATARPRYANNSNAFTQALQQQQLARDHDQQQAAQLEALQRARVQPQPPPQKQNRSTASRRSAGRPQQQRYSGSQTARVPSHRQPHPPSHSHSQAQERNGFSHSRSIPPLHLAPLQHAPQPSSVAAAQEEKQQDPSLPRPVTPVLHLDLHTARCLIPSYQQSIGGSVQTLGVDPHIKYRFPLTTNQRIGWNIANTTLEFFPPTARPVRVLSNRRLYGSD